ncbi:phosphoglycerate mutase family protein [Rhodococcus erythropolis SK121]|nr:phosphoglycerate mutase family protein [Rhodococcus erythropolis SK121]
MQDLYVVTHPHAEHTAQDVVGGWHNSVLTPAGRRDAGLIAEALKRRRTGTSRPVRITSSDLERCTETSTIIARTLDAPATTDTRLREISFGEAEGRPNSWLAQRQVPAPDNNRLDHHGPVAGAETRRDIASRVHEFMRELMDDLDHDHIVVTHGFAHTFVVSAWLQIPVEAAGFATFATTPGAITHLRHDDYWRNRTLAQLADTAHLDCGTMT